MFNFLFEIFHSDVSSKQLLTFSFIVFFHNEVECEKTTKHNDVSSEQLLTFSFIAFFHNEIECEKTIKHNDVSSEQLLTFSFIVFFHNEVECEKTTKRRRQTSIDITKFVCQNFFFVDFRSNISNKQLLTFSSIFHIQIKIECEKTAITFEHSQNFFLKVNAILLSYQKVIETMKILKSQRSLMCNTFEKKLVFFDKHYRYFFWNCFASKRMFES